jgi:hypothetical protein
VDYLEVTTATLAGIAMPVTVVVAVVVAGDAAAVLDALLQPEIVQASADKINNKANFFISLLL